jgi:hypothetical protein
LQQPWAPAPTILLVNSERVTEVPASPFANAFSVKILWFIDPRVAATLGWN